MYEQEPNTMKKRDLYIVDLNPFASLQESTESDVVVDDLNQKKSSEQVAANVSFYIHL